MLRAKLFVATAAGVLGLAVIYPGVAARLFGQDKPASAISAVARPNEQKERETRGEGLFLQRCSICHLPRNLKFGSPPTIGPALSGQFKSASAEDLKVLRGYILKGGPGMPGFQYGLEPKDVDDLIAFLKTF
jgi:mono/diheme cytochrome c family protein